MNATPQLVKIKNWLRPVLFDLANLAEDLARLQSDIKTKIGNENAVFTDLQLRVDSAIAFINQALERGAQ